MARQWPVAGALLAILWLFVRGVALEPTRILGEFLIGLGFGFPVAYATRRFYTEGTDLRRTVRSLPYVVIYLTVFLKDLAVANIDVAYRVLAPSMPIEPDVVAFPLRVRTDVAITTIANSISLTPGTITMDHDEEENVLFVHAINCEDAEDVTAPIRQWEEYALVIFDEELKPGDPVPETRFDAPATVDPDGTEGEVRDDGG